MSEPPFRAEALEHHRGRSRPGRLLRTAPRWTRVAFWLLVLAAAAGLVAGAVVQVDRVVFVPAAVEGDRFSATVAPEIAERAARCGRARVVTPGEAPAGVREMIVALDRVGGRLDRPLRGTGGTLRLCVGRRPLIADLVPGLGS